MKNKIPNNLYLPMFYYYWKAAKANRPKTNYLNSTEEK